MYEKSLINLEPKKISTYLLHSLHGRIEPSLTLLSLMLDPTSLSFDVSLFHATHFLDYLLHALENLSLKLHHPRLPFISTLNF